MENALLLKLKGMKAEVEDTLERMENDEPMYLEYLKKLPDNQNILKLREAVEAKEYKDAKREVHTLKGIALTLGLLPLADVCMDMQMDFDDGNPEEACAQLPDVEAEFKKWSQAISE